MDQYFVKILANIVTIDQPSVSRDPRENRELVFSVEQSRVASVSLVYSCVEGEGALMGPTSQQTLWPATRVNSDQIIAKCPPSSEYGFHAYRDLNGSRVL